MREWAVTIAHLALLLSGGFWKHLSVWSGNAIKGLELNKLFCGNMDDNAGAMQMACEISEGCKASRGCQYFELGICGSWLAVALG